MSASSRTLPATSKQARGTTSVLGALYVLPALCRERATDPHVPSVAVR